MTIDEIVTLIQAVSDNGLTSFVYEEGDQKLVLKKKKKLGKFLFCHDQISSSSSSNSAAEATAAGAAFCKARILMR